MDSAFCGERSTNGDHVRLPIRRASRTRATKPPTPAHGFRAMIRGMSGRLNGLMRAAAPRARRTTYCQGALDGFTPGACGSPPSRHPRRWPVLRAAAASRESAQSVLAQVIRAADTAAPGRPTVGRVVARIRAGDGEPDVAGRQRRLRVEQLILNARVTPRSHRPVGFHVGPRERGDRRVA